MLVSVDLFQEHAHKNKPTSIYGRSWNRMSAIKPHKFSLELAF